MNRPYEADLDQVSPLNVPIKHILLSLATIVGTSILGWLYRAGAGGLEGKAAVKQLENSDEAYATAQAVATSNVSGNIVLVGAAILIVIWGPFIMKQIRRKRLMRNMNVLGIMAIALIMTACGDYKVELLEEIAPDETAFVIALEGDTDANQAKFESVEFLEKKKVAAKRITIPQRSKSTGRMWYDYEWIPAARVIKIKRAPVTREWTDDPTSGTANKKQKLQVESLDSVGFAVGATIMCSIQEANAATFLYNFNGMQLETIIDTNIRGYAQMELAGRFGSLKLEACKMQKGAIFKEVEMLIQEKFTAMGITTSYFGSSEGLTYENPDIQKVIDSQVQSEARIQTEKNEKLAADEENQKKIAAVVAIAEAAKQAAQQDLEAQRIRNTNIVEMAEAKALAASKLLESKEAILLELEVYTRRKRAEAQVEAARNLSNIRILPAGSGLLMGLDSNK